MAKGVTNQPLYIVLADELYDHPEALKWMEAGHRVVKWSRMAPTPAPDIILHPAAHAWNNDMWDYGDAVLTKARANKRRKKA